MKPLPFLFILSLALPGDREMAGMMDILPTLVKLAGVRVPADQQIDGRDIWPLLGSEPGAKSPHEIFYYHRGLKLEAIRSGPWKLHLAKTELYNLNTDIGEATNVADAKSEVVAKLQALAAATKDDLALEGVGLGCRPLGRVENPLPLIDHDGKVRAGFEAN